MRRWGRVACVMRRLWSPLARSDTLEKLSKSLHVFHLIPPQLVVISMCTKRKLLSRRKNCHLKLKYCHSWSPSDDSDQRWGG